MNNAYPLKQVDKLLDTPELLIGTTGNAALEMHTDLFLEVHEVIATGITNLKAFPGQYRDSETGLSYNCYRVFAPSLGLAHSLEGTHHSGQRKQCKSCYGNRLKIQSKTVNGGGIYIESVGLASLRRLLRFGG
jgi:hypothetical protein